MNRSCVVVIPLRSKRGSGMCRAGVSLLKVIPSKYSPVESKWNRIFEIINDSRMPGLLKMLIRLFLVQFTLLGGKGLRLYASHHAPLFSFGKKYVVIIHDLISIENPHQHWLQTFLFKHYVPLVIQRAKKLVVISETTRRKVVRNYHIDSNNVSIVPSAFDTLNTWKQGGASFDIRQSKKQFLFVGAQYEHKNLNLLIKAVHEMNDPEINVFVINGSSQIWGKFLTEEERSTFSLNFHFYDHVSDEFLERVYEESLALVYVSKMEGFGIPPLEAYYKACPVIASDIEVLLETCGNAAAFVSTDDPNVLAEKLAYYTQDFDQKQYDEIVELGYREIDRFSVAKISKKWDSVLFSFFK